MKDLWRKTWKLLRNFPILWVPCLCAELVAICIWQLRGMAEEGIFKWYLASHPVLGRDVVPLGADRAMSFKAAMAFAPVGIAAIFAGLCVFVAAFMVTAKMAEAVGCGQGPDMRAAWGKVVPRWRRIPIFSAKFIAIALAMAIAAIAAVLPAEFLLRALHHRGFLGSTVFTNLFTITLACCLTLLLTPKAIRLLQSDQRVQVPAESKRCAMVFAVGVNEVRILLWMFAQWLAAGMVVGHKWEPYAISILSSTVENMLIVPLFVALALIALQSQQDAAKQTDPGSPLLPSDPLAE